MLPRLEGKIGGFFLCQTDLGKPKGVASRTVMPVEDWRTIVSQQTQQRVSAVEQICNAMQRKALDFPAGAEYQLAKLMGAGEKLDAAAAHVLHILSQLPGAGAALQADQDADSAIEGVESLLDDTFAQVDLACDAAHEAVRKRKEQEASIGSSAPQATLAAATKAHDPKSQPIHQQAAHSPKDRARVRDDKRAMLEVAMQQAATIPKPQKGFVKAPDNSNSPFVPYWSLSEESQGKIASQAPGSNGAKSQRLQRLGVAGNQLPHAHLLSNLVYPDAQLSHSTPQMPQALDDTPFTLVTTPEELQSMAEHLATCSEIAVDLEHHSLRTFQGITCLLQLSTREQDFVVDVIGDLWDLIGPALAPVFADPKVVKVLHGSERDVQWLQRDFGIFIVNLFDTHQAACALRMPHKGYGHLLQHYCGVETDKRYQLADWRLRPLPADMLLYARLDTRYLLYIHDCMKEELTALGLDNPAANNGAPQASFTAVPAAAPMSALEKVLERSKALCMVRYEKDLFTEGSYLGSCPGGLSAKQEAVYAGLYAWRDKVCRAQDESTGHHQLFGRAQRHL
ncbi:hypothetical protein WJX73_001618 [Symbiochloris irregularis]|uniref:3'-5' exonuclease domain-containing protein n=1 Tax=Symbiochloris irregularis TaxID=706552 RepID=A0AAW1PVI9_9CHLO